jgi:plasmid stabilization system protein ParE
MAAKLLWSLQAREDLLNIYVVIGMDNVEAAERLYSAIEAKANLLITHRRIGRASTRNSPIYPHVDRRPIFDHLRNSA